MSLRRRLVLLFAAYCVIIGIGGALVVWISAERDQEVDRQTPLIEQAAVDSFDRAALIESQDRLDDLRAQLTIAAIVVLGVALVMTVVAAILVRRWVTRPIERVASAVRDARAGDVGVIAPQGPPEIAGLARDVDSMRLDMNRALFDAVRAREIIEQSASVVFTLRSELAAEIDDLPGDWTCAAELLPAEGIVAGDCYDVITITPTVLGLIVVDISGHGSVSGIVALRCKELLRAGLRNGLEPGDAIQWGADQLDDLGDETFLSTFVAVVDLASGDVRYASAGHPPPILCVGDRPTELAPDRTDRRSVSRPVVDGDDDGRSRRHLGDLHGRVDRGPERRRPGVRRRAAYRARVRRDLRRGVRGRQAVHRRGHGVLS